MQVLSHFLAQHMQPGGAGAGLPPAGLAALPADAVASTSGSSTAHVLLVDMDSKFDALRLISALREKAVAARLQGSAAGERSKGLGQGDSVGRQGVAAAGFTLTAASGSECEVGAVMQTFVAYKAQHKSTVQQRATNPLPCCLAHADAWVLQALSQFHLVSWQSAGTAAPAERCQGRHAPPAAV